MDVEVIYGNGYSTTYLSSEELTEKIQNEEIEFIVTDGTNNSDELVLDTVGEYTIYYSCNGIQSEKEVYNVYAENKVVSINLDGICDYYCVNAENLMGYIEYTDTLGIKYVFGNDFMDSSYEEFAMPNDLTLEDFVTATPGDITITISADDVIATKTVHIYSEEDYNNIIVAKHAERNRLMLEINDTKDTTTIFDGKGICIALLIADGNILEEINITNLGEYVIADTFDISQLGYTSCQLDFTRYIRENYSMNYNIDDNVVLDIYIEVYTYC